MGRWISQDPQGEAGGVNLYNFIDNGIVNYYDNLGLERKFTPDSQYCQSLKRRMDNILKEIEQRQKDLDDNPQGLPETCPGDDTKPRLSREGHRRIIQKLHDQYRTNYNTYTNRCGGPPNGYAPVLVIDPKYLPTPVAYQPLPWWARGGNIIDNTIDITGKVSTVTGLVALGTAAYFSGAGAPAGSSAFGAAVKTAIQIFSKGATVAPAL